MRRYIGRLTKHCFWLLLVMICGLAVASIAETGENAKEEHAQQQRHDDAGSDKADHDKKDKDDQERHRRHKNDDGKHGKKWRGHHDEGQDDRNCYAQCQANCSLRSDGVTAEMCQQSCARFCGGYSEKQGGKSGTPDDGNRPPRWPHDPPVLAIYYGAIALSPATLAHAAVAGYLTQGEAEQKALTVCKSQNPRRPDDCIVALWFRGVCGALAIQDDPLRRDWGWGAAWGAVKEAAEAQALIKCNSHTIGKNCAVVTSICAR